ncbi:chloride channel protein [Hippea jasoniae]|uniref:chloride channel protein n=1 Tax=Hippea jasoniae TaxID=944479 RepID=UPI0018DBDBD5|nr:chloride channel protein [Hippea jasoniae]
MRKARFFIDTILIGIIGAIAAQVFIFLIKLTEKFTLEKIAHFTPLDVIHIISHQPHSPINHILLIAVITAGGLISGFLVYTFAPESEGHGTDTAVRAFHRTGGYIRPIVTPIKIIASAITIGTGGSAGREGPTALFSSGVGSIYAHLRNATLEERRLFVLIGMASGLSAVFRAPIGTAIFAIEVLYSDMDFESSALVYTMLGSLIAYILSGFLWGFTPIFYIQHNISITSIDSYIYLTLLGIASGFIAIILPVVFYSTRDFFHMIKIPPHFKPAIGAFGVGLIALVFPEVLGGGYGWIQSAINGQIATNILFYLVFAKIAAFSLTVSSGGSGGVFAPTLFVGAMLGSLFAALFHQPFAAFSIIAMAAVFGAAARAPLATVIMVSEMTGGYSLLAPATLAVMIAYFLQSELTKKLNIKYSSLYEAQVPDKGFSPVHQINTLRNILLCHTPILSMKPEIADDKKILNLLESGIPIEIEDNKALFFGTVKNTLKLEKINTRSFYKTAEILYIFRNGKWLHPTQIVKLKKGDEALIYGDTKTINEIKDNFESISQTFSKLKLQTLKLKKHAQSGSIKK